MLLVPVLIWAQLVLVPAALLHAAEVNQTSCDHERSRSSREVLQQVDAHPSPHLRRLRECSNAQYVGCSTYCQWQ